MPRPEVVDSAEILYEDIGEAFTDLDGEATSWHLLLLCDVIAAVCFQQIHGYVSDAEDRPGWQIVFDPDDAPAEVLAYLAQFSGAELLPEMTEADQRAAIKDPEGPKRGRVESIRKAIQARLTGSKTVLIEERFEDSAWKIWVRTYASETPIPGSIDLITGVQPPANSAAAALLSQKPMGIVPTYEAITGQSYSDLEAAHADYDDIAASYDDYEDLRSTLP